MLPGWFAAADLVSLGLALGGFFGDLGDVDGVLFWGVGHCASPKVRLISSKLVPVLA